MSRSRASIIAELPEAEREAFFAQMSTEQKAALRYDWSFWARPEQIVPVNDPDYDGTLVLAGRGFGKTRTAAEWVRGNVERSLAGRIAIVAETAADARDVLVEGESGILACSPPWFKPLFEPSKRRLTWPNGAVASLFNGTEPDQLRGPQFDLAIVDELAKYQYAQETWDMLMFGLRLGSHPRWMVTTTPRPEPVIKQLIRETKPEGGEAPRVRLVKGSTSDNMANLAPQFIRNVVKRYAGTRLGRQELEAELLEDTPGALWSQALLDAYRVRHSADRDFTRVVVGVDPAISSGEKADDTGIVVVALGEDRHGYVLDDKSGQLKPMEWAKAAVLAFKEHSADLIVAEKNQGGEMVETTIHAVDPNVPVRLVHSQRGKVLRAEPVSALYEQGRIHHIGEFRKLEDQMASFTVDLDRRKNGSPDRVDALVHGLTELFPHLTSHRGDGKTVVLRRERNWRS